MILISGVYALPIGGHGFGTVDKVGYHGRHGRRKRHAYGRVMFRRKPPVREGLGSRPIIALVGTVDPVRAKAFYAGALGLRLISEDGFALIFDAGGTKLRVSVVRAVVPASYTVLGWLVPDIQQAVRDLAQRSVVFQRFDGMAQDDLGIWTAPGGTKVAWFRDPDGNTLSLTQT